MIGNSTVNEYSRLILNTGLFAATPCYILLRNNHGSIIHIKFHITSLCYYFQYLF